MRLHKIKTVKPIQPLTPSAARINALKQTKALERVRTAQQLLAKARINLKIKRLLTVRFISDCQNY